MTTAFTKLKPLLTLLLGFFAALGVLSLTQSHPAQAQGPGVNLAALAAQVAALKAQVAALQATTAPLSVMGTPGTFPATLTITGVNVQIVDGSGATNSASGLGNLTIGYNQTRIIGDARTGSHNLILGDQNDYSRFGGLVAGFHNAISGSYASVGGGFFNTASGSSASVSGGHSNTASGNSASVSGGNQNVASGNSASVSGGAKTEAKAPFSSVSGGRNLTQSAPYGWSGGSEAANPAFISGDFTSP